MNILDEIADRTRQRIAEQKRDRPLPSMRAAAEAALARDSTAQKFPVEEALRQPELQFIAEVKRASPSKGLIAPDFPYLQIARDYEAAGAAAISCLTEPCWFQGRNEYLSEIAREVGIPVLRKDFVVDEYMVYEAKALGAQAVLLICAILDNAQLAAYRELCDELGLSALVEAHTAREVERAVACGARVIGVNNRDLKTFTVDMGAAQALRDLVPADTLFVSESGIKTAADVQAARAMRADAVLVGETLMRTADKRAKLAELRGEAVSRTSPGAKRPVSSQNRP